MIQPFSAMRFKRVVAIASLFSRKYFTVLQKPGEKEIRSASKKENRVAYGCLCAGISSDCRHSPLTIFILWKWPAWLKSLLLSYR